MTIHLHSLSSNVLMAVFLAIAIGGCHSTTPLTPVTEVGSNERRLLGYGYTRQASDCAHWGYGCPNVAPTQKSPGGALQFIVSIENALVPLAPERGQGFSGPVIYNVAPKIRIQVLDQDRNMATRKPIHLDLDLKFETREDGIQPVFNKSLLKLTPDAFEYVVPFSMQSILFAGDQWIEVSARDRGLATGKAKFQFAVGAHDWAAQGNQLLAVPSAEQDSAESEEAEEPAEHFGLLRTTPKMPRPIRQPARLPVGDYRKPPIPKSVLNKPQLQVPADKFFGRTLKFGLRQVPRYYLNLVNLGVNASIGSLAVGIVFLGDEAFNSFKTYFTNVLNKDIFRFDIPEIGPVVLTVDDWALFHASNPELSISLLTDSIVALKQRDTLDFELWGKDPAFVHKIGTNYLLVYKKFGYLFKFIIRDEANNLTPSTVLKYKNASGVFHHATGVQTTDPVYQWSDIISYIGEYRIGGSPQWSNNFNNIRPSFPIRIIGNINDINKPYDIVNGFSAMAGGRARARADRPIVETFPMTKEYLIQRAEEHFEIPFVSVTDPKKVYSRAGHSFEKHGSRPGNIFGKATGNVEAKSKQGNSIFREIVLDTNRTLQRINQGASFEYKMFIKDGRGVEIWSDGWFKGFIQANEVKPLPISP